jgi:hypothetical protein
MKIVFASGKDILILISPSGIIFTIGIENCLHPSISYLIIVVIYIK